MIKVIEPKQMAQRHPALYHQLKRYYKLEPVEWIDLGRNGRAVAE